MPRIPRHPSRSSSRSAEPHRSWRALGALLLGGSALVCLGELLRHMAAP